MKNIVKIALVGVMLGLTFGIIFGYVPVQVERFKAAIQDTTQVVNCSNCDFRGVQELAGVDAHGVHMPGVTFQSCVPTDTNRSNTNMVCITGQVAQLSGINLANANLTSSCFDGAMLEKADLTGADFTNAFVQNARLKDAKVTGIKTDNATFCNAIMPDGSVCTDTWTGQGVTILCNCDDVSAAAKTDSSSKNKQQASSN